MQIHQLLPNLSYGDAISNHALGLQGLLREWGHESEIYAQYIHPAMAGRCRVWSELQTDERSITIYHHSIGSAELFALYRALRGRRVLVYHNITPHHFFEPYNARLAELVRHGRENLPRLRQGADLVLADSAYNGQELAELGFPEPHVLPILVDLAAFDAVGPDRTRLPDDRTTFLFVGRISPNKRQEDVIRLFARYHRFIDRRSRLVLVGDHGGMEPYLRDLWEVAASLEVERSVHFTGSTRFEELAGWYRQADLFCCMSEHEGFCVPLLEAMHHDLPVLAYASSAVPETLGDAGVLFREKDLPLLAEMAHLLLADEELRRRIVEGQRRRLRDFEREAVAARFKTYLDLLL